VLKYIYFLFHEQIQSVISGFHFLLHIFGKFFETAFDFSSLESPTFKWTSIEAGYGIGYTDINGVVDFNMYLDSYAVSGSYNLKSPTNQALTLTTNAGTDPTVGNSDLDVVVWYSIEDVNV